MGFKNYYNSHKDEIHKEIDIIQKLDLTKQLLDHFSSDQDSYLNELNNAPAKFNIFTDLEKFVDSRLKI